MPETVRLVLNRNSEQPYVLHREDRPTIQHQVRGDLSEELPAGGSRISFICRLHGADTMIDPFE